MQHMKRKVVRPSDSDRQVKSGQFRRKSIEVFSLKLSDTMCFIVLTQ
jgi:hypothetical protein